MTKPERDKLRQLASEATPGPWKHDYGNGEVECEHDDYWRMSIVSRASYGRHEEDSWKRPGKLINPNDDCEYIAAVNPSVITQLLDQLDEYEEALKEIAGPAITMSGEINLTNQEIELFRRSEARAVLDKFKERE